MTMFALSSLLLLGSLQGAEELPPRQANRPVPVYNFSLLLIGRNVDDASPADEQFGWGLEFDARDPRDMMGWEFSVTRSSDETSSGAADFEATLIEFALGARKTWGAPGQLHPFVSGGLAFVNADAELSGGPSEDDSSFGLYARGGAYYTFGKHFNLGVDVKTLVGTDIEFGDANYIQAGVILGFSM